MDIVRTAVRIGSSHLGVPVEMGLPQVWPLSYINHYVAPAQGSKVKGHIGGIMPLTPSRVPIWYHAASSYRLGRQLDR